MDSDSSTDLAIPPALAAQIQAAAEEEHRPAIDVLRDALVRYLRESRPERHGRVAFKTEDLSAAELDAITEGGMDPRHDHLDAELE
jgi:hypothetical protein